MYDHIPGKYRAKFVQWIFCNNVTVLHHYRDSVVDSFWSEQARVVDTISGHEYIDSNTRDARMAKAGWSNVHGWYIGNVAV